MAIESRVVAMDPRDPSNFAERSTTAAGPGGFPPVEEIDRVAGLSDLVLRNLLITQGYHELSAALAGRLGSSLNWCTFATWASKQAGRTIRREDLARLVELELAAAPELARALGEVAEAARRLGSRLDLAGFSTAALRALLGGAALDRTSEAISRGNHKVFAEIAREFSRFLATFSGDTAFDGERIARFASGLRPGDPPEGQGLLRSAFSHLYEALFATDPKARAERVHLATLEIGFHEQTRLQPEIAAALDAALPDREEIRRHLLQALFSRSGLFLRMRSRLPRVLRRMSPLDRALDRLFGEVRRILRRVLTEVLIRIELPGGRVLRLGRDLAVAFPGSLATIADPELRTLLARIDPTPDSLAGSGAEDWADFAERMHYLADFFRCLHEDAALLGPPFSPAQVADLRAGRKPAGRL